MHRLVRVMAQEVEEEAAAVATAVVPAVEPRQMALEVVAAEEEVEEAHPQPTESRVCEALDQCAVPRIANRIVHPTAVALPQVALVWSMHWAYPTPVDPATTTTSTTMAHNKTCT